MPKRFLLARGMKPTLPIDSILPDLCEILAKKPAVVLRAPPGAGKTTRVPPALLRSGFADSGKIVMLEPRRVAARAAARRIASELGTRVGDLVGYHIRFDRKASPETRILVVTEGILVQMLQSDPFLEGIGTVIFDEFHERHLSSDLALAMAFRAQNDVRPDLRLVVMSATLDPGPVAEWLGGCPVLESSGRQYPVEIRYLPQSDPRPLHLVAAQAVRRALGEAQGDLLVFLPGVGEIRRTAEQLGSLGDVRVLPLHGSLTQAEQDAVLAPSTRRKVVLATNVAETSITIDGIRAVIDTGWARIPRFDASVGLDRLERVRISVASADQRAGRAGRQAPGICLRLWTQHEQMGLQKQEMPEIRRIDLAQPLLQLLAWGEPDPREFRWFEAPDGRSLERGMELLRDLGAIDSKERLTRSGRQMARFPGHPRLARMMVEAHRLGAPRPGAFFASLLSERDVVFRPAGDRRPLVASAHSRSDLLDRYEAVEENLRSGYGETPLGPVPNGRARQIGRIAEQLMRWSRRSLGPPPPLEESPEDAALRALLSAYPDRVARRREPNSRRGRMVGGRGVVLDEMSAVRQHELFLCLELDAGGRSRSEARVRIASAIELEWLEELGVESRDLMFFDTERERVVGERRSIFRDLPLSSVEIEPEPARAAEVLGRAARDQIARVLPEDPTFHELIRRIACLSHWMPELGLEPVDDSRLGDLAVSLASGLRTFRELRAAPWLATLRASFDHRTWQQIERHAPTHIEVPSGSRIRLRYEPGKPPVLAVRIQEMFGLGTTPVVAGGRQPVLLHLLAPNQRPQQITDNLESFWRNTYPEIRKELRARYPRHAWPEDPTTASPERRPLRRRKSR